MIFDEDALVEFIKSMIKASDEAHRIEHQEITKNISYLQDVIKKMQIDIEKISAIEEPIEEPIENIINTILSVTLRGTKAGDDFAHFSLYVNDEKVLDSYSSDEMTEYSTSIPLKVEKVEKVVVEFTNDAIISTQDRNLFVKEIKLVESTNESIIIDSNLAVYRKYDGSITATSNGVMPWTGKLTFILNGSEDIISPPVVVIPDEEEVEGGLKHFYSDAELTLWKHRIENKIYWYLNQYKNNTPCNGSDIERLKNIFMNENIAPYPGPENNAKQPKNTGYWGYNNQPRSYPVPSWANDVHHWYERHYTGYHKDAMCAAAFWGKVYEDSNIIKKVVSKLVEQASHPGVDFSNTSIWKPNIQTKLPGQSAAYSFGTFQHNPFFFLGDWLAQNCKVYDYVSDYMTDIQKATVKNWLRSQAYFHMNNIEPEISNIYEDRDNLIVKTDRLKKHSTTHDNGYNISNASVMYNNRVFSSQAVGIALAGLVTNDKTLQDYTKKITKEFFALSVYPDGTGAEFHRGGHAGIRYLQVMICHLCEIAESFDKYNGDSWLWDFKTNEGIPKYGEIHSTQGGEKGIPLLIKSHSNYYNGVWNRTSGGKPINGYAPAIGKRVFHQGSTGGVLKAWRHYKEDWMLDFALMHKDKGYGGWRDVNIVNYIGHIGFWKSAYGNEEDVLLKYGPDPIIFS